MPCFYALLRFVGNTLATRKKLGKLINNIGKATSDSVIRLLSPSVRPQFRP